MMLKGEGADLMVKESLALVEEQEGRRIKDRREKDWPTKILEIVGYGFAVR